MTGFVAFRWDPRQADPSALVRRLSAKLARNGWDTALDQPGWSVLCEANAPLPLRGFSSLPHMIVMGHLAQSRKPATVSDIVVSDAQPDSDFERHCADLLARNWGAYVALAPSQASPTAVQIFRDPLGLVDVAAWQVGGISIVTSRGSEVVAQAPPPEMAIDWVRLGQLVRCPGGAGEAIPMIGVNSPPPGAITLIDGASLKVRHLWTPSIVARRPPRRAPRAELVTTIDDCVATWSRRSGRVMAELSGGLDSAIVAASLARCRPPETTRFVHFHASDAPSDERPYARAVADHLKVDYEEHYRPDTALSRDTIDQIPLGLRPSLASLSVFHDQALAGQARRWGADALFTGQGGDALFYQFATPLIGDDIWRAPLPIGRKVAMTASLARWTGHSTWAVMAAALRARAGAAPAPDPHFPLDLVTRAIPHRRPALDWIGDMVGLPPTRQLQIVQLASLRAVLAPSWSSQVAAVVHPLFSQPIVEQCLSIPVLDLTGARRDRALVREAYAGHLPSMLLERPGKGWITAYYGRMLIRSLPVLRDYLLDGLLVGNRILGRETLEAVLDENFLIQNNCYAEIFCALFAERWARGWHSFIAPA